MIVNYFIILNICLVNFKGSRWVCVYLNSSILKENVRYVHLLFFTINHIVYVIILLSQAEKRKCL